MSDIKAPPETKLITGDELLARGDIGRCELIDGRIVPMSPAGAEHGILELNLALALKLFVQERQLGQVMTGKSVFIFAVTLTGCVEQILFSSQRKSYPYSGIWRGRHPDS